MIHLLQIYKKFYRDVKRRAELLDGGISKIQRVVRESETVEIAMESCELAEDWNGLIRSYRGKCEKYSQAVFMIDCCDMFFSLNEL